MMKVKMRTREASEEEGDEDGGTDEVEAREEYDSDDSGKNEEESQ